MRGTECHDCPVGTESSESRTSCLECEPGTYTDQASSNCTNCDAGEYQPRKGQDQCLQCEPGHFSEGAAAACTQCPAGFFQLESGSSDCEPCAAGMYSQKGAHQCSYCPVSTYQDREAQSECLACPEGTMTKEGSVDCFGCPAGQDLGRVNFAEAGVAGASVAQDDVNCPFLYECLNENFRTLQYWSWEKSGWWDSVERDQFLWFKFQEAKVIVAFAFQIVEEYAPLKAMNFVFYGTNSIDCQTDLTDLYEPIHENKMFVQLENKKLFTCYGFKIPALDKVAIRPPVQVSTIAAMPGCSWTVNYIFGSKL